MKLHRPVYNVALGNIWFYEFINIFLRDWHWIITVYLNTPPWTLPLITDVHTESEKESERRVVSCWDVFDPWGHKKNIAQMYIWVFLNNLWWRASKFFKLCFPLSDAVFLKIIFITLWNKKQPSKWNKTEVRRYPPVI